MDPRHPMPGLKQSMSSLSIHENPRGVVFKILVQPRSSKNMIVGIHGGALKIKLTAPPVEGAANRMCLKFLAKCLGVSRAALEIVAGASGRTKQVLLQASDGADLQKEQNHLKHLIETRLIPPKTP